MQLSNHHTSCSDGKRAVIEEALREYVKRRKQLRIIDYFGRIDYDDDFDYKLQRYQKWMSLKQVSVTQRGERG